MAIKRKIQRSADAYSIMLNEAFENFITEKEAQGISDATLKNYRQSYDYFCQYNGLTDETAAEEVSETQIYRWINTMKQNGVKTSSINHYLRDVRTFLYWAMAEPREYISPAFKVKNGQWARGNHKNVS